MLDANQRSALAIIRSLGLHGLNVVAGDQFLRSLGAASRYAAASVQYPNPAASPEAFVREIIAIIERLDIDTVIPVTDLTTMLLVSQPILSKFTRLVAPETASYESLTDKAQLLELAGRLGIQVPLTRLARTTDGVIEAAHEIGFPLVLKPARSRYLKGSTVVSTSVTIVENHEHLKATLEHSGWLRDIPCLVQRFVPGYGAGVFALFASAQAIAWFAHRRIREKPPSGGVSVLCESVPIDPVLQSAAEKLLTSAQWSGVAMVEFRVAHDGTPHLMEVNGRFWGSLQLAIDCGVDFPWLAYQITTGLPTVRPQPYAVGKRLRWLLGDLDSLIIALRRRPSTLRSKLRAIARFLSTFLDQSCRQEVFRIADPYPAIRELANWLRCL